MSGLRLHLLQAVKVGGHGYDSETLQQFEDLEALHQDDHATTAIWAQAIKHTHDKEP